MNSEMREPAQHLSPPLRQSGGNTAPTQEHAIPVSLKLFVCKAKCVPARGRNGVRRYMTASSRRVKAGGVGAGGEVARELQRAQSLNVSPAPIGRPNFRAIQDVPRACRTDGCTQAARHAKGIVS